MSLDTKLIKQHNYNKNFQNLLLIHGWGFNSNIWQYNIAHLKQLYNIYTLDLNGHGENIFNNNFSNLDTYLDAIISSLTAYISETSQQVSNNNNKISIIGWSLGGIIALNLKHKHPDIISKTILCCSNPCFLSNHQWAHGVDQNIWDKFVENLLSNPNKTIKEFLLLQTLSNNNSKALYKQLLTIHKNSTTASREGLNWGLDILSKNHIDFLDSIDNSDISFIFGSKDKLVNISLAEWLHDNYPNIYINIFKQSGHMPFITEPDEFYNHIIKII